MLLLINYITNSMSRASCPQAFLCNNLVYCSIFIGAIMFTKKEIMLKKKGECVECTSHVICGTGYPNVRRNGKYQKLSRYLYAKKYGNIPKGKVIRHTCDNRWCVNIDHLIIGTQKQNIQDAVERKRMAQGEKHYCAKLTVVQVKEIKNTPSLSIGQLGNKYNVSPTTIYDIRRGKTWKSVI